MILKDWLKLSEQVLSHEQIPTARLDAQLLASKVLDLDRSVLLASDDRALTASEEQRLSSLMAERVARKPVAQLLGGKEFYGRKFKVNDQVLTPRPESEAIIDYAVAHVPFGARVLDIGTGSGALAVTLKLERPDLLVTGSDLSESALTVAEANAERLEATVDLVRSDLLADLKGLFNVIIANLPYLTPAQLAAQPELAHEPSKALVSGVDGLDHYQRLFGQLADHLTDKGWVLIEHMPEQRPALTDLANEHHFRLSRVSDFVSRLSPKSL